ncbi:MAG: hypothetical protein CMF59_14080 [Leptospiraceae bacterium]|nr:hypothetical protein [Leptospiraceae bacterium]
MGVALASNLNLNFPFPDELPGSSKKMDRSFLPVSGSLLACTVLFTVLTSFHPIPVYGDPSAQTVGNSVNQTNLKEKDPPDRSTEVDQEKDNPGAVEEAAPEKDSSRQVATKEWMHGTWKSNSILTVKQMARDMGHDPEQIPPKQLEEMAASLDSEWLLEIDGARWKFTYDNTTSFGRFTFDQRGDHLDIVMIEEVNNQVTAREPATVEKLEEDVMLIRFKGENRDVFIIMERQEIYL